MATSIYKPCLTLFYWYVPSILVLSLVAFIGWRNAQWNKLQANIRAESQLSRSLDYEREVLAQKKYFKRSMVQSYLRNETSLKIVAETLLDLDKAQPAWMEILRANFPGECDLEREARLTVLLIVMWAEDQAAALLKDRLRTDFQVLFPRSEEVCFSLTPLEMVLRSKQSKSPLSSMNE
jgi:hypothetical protein